MSTTNVETEVVQMRFDNKNFEKNVKESMDSVDKLKDKLNFDTETKSFQKLEENAKKVNFNPLIYGLEKVKASFSMLDTFSFTIYQRLSNRLIDIGHKITAGVSTDGIKSGFSEYELKMNSFKTIKASAGKDFSDAKINEYLEELNRYADKTIYSFSDMTNNIGKFTNAGVKLDVAVQAIKGISNEAAVSGANAQEASRAMYNFSQALSAGYVKLIDWKSIENANMATEEFKTQLLETAAELNVVKKNADGSYKTIKKGTPITATKNFNESLQEQWMTTEVLTKTLAKYANETTDIGKKAFDAAQKVNTFSKMMDTLKESVQSGWSQIWELVIGDLEHATNLWTALSNAIGGVIDKFFAERKAVIQTWKENGGLERTLQALKDILKGLGAVLDAVSRAWHSVFPAKSTAQKAQGLMHLTMALENFAKKIQPGSKILQQITNTFKGFFSVLNIVREAAKAFYNTFGKFFLKILRDALGTIFDVSGGLGQMLYSISKSVTQNQTFYKTFKSIVDILEWVYNGVKKVAGILWDFAGTVKDAVGESGGFTAFKKWFDGLKQAIMNFDIGAIASSIVAMFKGLWKIIDKTIENTFDFYKPFKEKMADFKNQIKNSKFGQWVVDFYKKIVDGVQKIFDSFRDVNTDGIDEMNEKTKKKLGIFEKIVNFFKKVGEVIKKVAMTIWPFIKSVVSSIGTGIQMLWEGVTENIKNSDLGDAGGLMAGGGLLALGLAIKKFVTSLKPMFTVMGKLGDGSFLKNIFKVLGDASKLIKAHIIKEIAVSLLILVGALFVLCTLPQDKLVAATASMGVLFQGLTSVFKSLDGGMSDGSAEGAKSEAGRLFGIATTLLAISLAMVVLTAALKRIGNMDVESLTIGTIVLGLLFKMVASTIEQILSIGQKTRGAKAGSVDIQAKGVASMIKQLGKSLIYIMAAVAILAWVTNKFGAGAALGAVVGIVAIMTVIAHLMETIMMYSTQQNSLQVKGAKALGVAASIIGIAFVIKEVAKAMVMVIGVIGILALALTNGWIEGWKIVGAITAFAAVLTGILVAINVIKNIAKDVDLANVGKITLLMGVVTLFVNAMAVLTTVLALLPSNWAATGSGVILAISSSISLILVALTALLKNYELSYVDVKGISAIMTAVTLSILAVSAAVLAISQAVGEGNYTKTVLVLLGIASAIAGIVFMIGKFNSVARGVKTFSNAMAALGIAAAGFAAAATLIIIAISKVNKMSDSEINKIGTNMKKVATAILTASDQIIGILAGLVRIVVETVITTAVTTIIGSAGRIIDGLIELCDVLLVKAPTLVEKLILVLAEVLAQFERRCGPLIAQVVSTVATIIEQVAQAILDNADKIINAIDKVITAVSTLIVKSIAKIFGFDKFKGAVNTLIKIVKPVSAALLAMFAYAKIKKNAQVIITVLNTLKNRLKLFRAGLSSGGFANGWKEFLGINKLNEDWKIAVTAHKEGWASLGETFKLGGQTLLKAVGVGSAVGLALGSLVKSFIDAKTDAIDATKTWAEEVDKNFGKLSKAIEDNSKEIQEKRSELTKSIYSIDTNYSTGTQKMSRLMDIIDQKTGKIKEGKEEEAANLVKDVNSVLGDQLVIENGILKMLDAQGQARKFELEQLQNIVATEQLREKIEAKKKWKEEMEAPGGPLEKSKTARDEAERQLREATTVDAYDTAIKAINDFNAQLHTGTIEAWDDELKKVVTRAVTEEDFERFKQKVNEFNSQFGAMLNTDDFDRFLSTGEYTLGMNKYRKEIFKLYRDKKDAYDAANNTYKQNISDINNYYTAVRALEEGDIPGIKKWNTAFSGIYKTTYKAETKESEADRLTKEIQQASKKADEYVYDAIKKDYDAAKQYYTDVGKWAKLADLEAAWKEYDKNFKALAKDEPIDEKSGMTKSEINDLISSYATKGLSPSSATDELKKRGISDPSQYLGDYEKLLKSRDSDSLLTMAGRAGFMGGSAYADAFVGKLSDAFLGEKTSSIFTSIFEGIQEDVGDGFFDLLQNSIFPAIAGLTGNSSMFGSLFPVNFGGIQNGSGLSGTANAPALSFAAPLPYQASLDTINTNLSKLTDRMVEQTNSITNEIKGLRTDVTDLGTRIDGLEVMLDGDALVGRLTPRINNSLVTYANRVGRGV